MSFFSSVENVCCALRHEGMSLCAAICYCCYSRPLHHRSSALHDPSLQSTCIACPCIPIHVVTYMSGPLSLSLTTAPKVMQHTAKTVLKPFPYHIAQKIVQVFVRRLGLFEASSLYCAYKIVALLRMEDSKVPGAPCLIIPTFSVHATLMLPPYIAIIESLGLAFR